MFFINLFKFINLIKYAQCIIHGNIKDFAKQRYNTPYACNVI